MNGVIGWDSPIGRLQIASDQYQVSLDNREIKLSPTEFSLLEYMAHHADRLISAQELVDAIA